MIKKLQTDNQGQIFFNAPLRGANLFPVQKKQLGFCAAVALFTLLVLLQSACTSEHKEPTLFEDTGLFKTYVQGPLTLIQKTNKTEITVAEQLEMMLEASAPENIEVVFPTYSVSLGDFTLKDIKLHPARMTGAGDVRVSYVASYLLGPYLPGTYSIPPMTVTYRDRNNHAGTTQILTENIQVEVKSTLDQGDDNIEIKDIKGPLSLPENVALQILLAVIVLLLTILGLAGFLYWRKISSNKKPIVVQLRPEEIALQELKRLLAENLLARGEVKTFHLRISDILRYYIENRFGIRAPERTTEEFLTELSVAQLQKNSLLGSHKALLTDFLIHCDLVKFAKHEPTTAECEKTVSICREFIEETKENIEDLKN